MIAIAIAGAGAMARVRARALLRTGSIEICGVASRHLDSARAFGAQFGCDACFDDVSRLLATGPDAVLVEVPTGVQDEIVAHALRERLPVLVGGPLASTRAAGEALRTAADGLVVEAGFEARYKPAWEALRELVAGGAVGTVTAIRTAALWRCEPRSWWARQEDTGGMPLAHMTYCFVNPLRWVFGEPTHVSAFAGTAGVTALREETCVANLRFPGGIVCSSTASFVKSAERESWVVWVLGTEAAIELLPTEMDAGALRLHRGTRVETTDFAAAPDAFTVQAQAFLDSLAGPDICRNPIADALGDLRVAEAIVASARTLRTVELTVAAPADREAGVLPSLAR